MDKTKTVKTRKTPTPAFAVISFLVIVAVLVALINLGVDTTMSVFIAALIAVVIALLLDIPWADVERTLLRVVSDCIPTFLIVIMVGMLVGIWMAGGTVPALMYYICIFSTVDVESLKANLTGMDLKDIPKLLPVLKKSAKLLLPIAVLILSLCVFGFSTSRSALYSMAVLIICCCFDKDDRFSLKKLVNALRSGAIGSTTVITATAICGIIISMLTMTGLGVKFSSLLISLGSSSLLISLLLAMLVCIVLGMGLPTAAAYIIASSTIATALIKLGVPVLGRTCSCSISPPLPASPRRWRWPPMPQPASARPLP